MRDYYENKVSTEDIASLSMSEKKEILKGNESFSDIWRKIEESRNIVNISNYLHKIYDEHPQLNIVELCSDKIKEMKVHNRMYSEYYKYKMIQTLWLYHTNNPKSSVYIKQKPHKSKFYERVISWIGNLFTQYDERFSTTLSDPFRLGRKTTIWLSNKNMLDAHSLRVYLIVLHELVHVEQMRKLSPILFYIIYILCLPLLFTVRSKLEAAAYLTEYQYHCYFFARNTPIANGYSDRAMMDLISTDKKTQKTFSGSSYLFMDPLQLNKMPQKMRKVRKEYERAIRLRKAGGSFYFERELMRNPISQYVTED